MSRSATYSPTIFNGKIPLTLYFQLVLKNEGVTLALRR